MAHVAYAADYREEKEKGREGRKFKESGKKRRRTGKEVGGRRCHLQAENKASKIEEDKDNGSRESGRRS